MTLTLSQAALVSAIIGGSGAWLFVRRWFIITDLMRLRYTRIGPFYHAHRMGEPYGVPMEEDHIRCLVCDREYSVSWRPRFSATEPK